MSVSLFTSPLASMAHPSVFLPWLRGVASSAPVSRRWTCVLAPHRADLYYLKSLALQSGIGLWNVRFLTPSDLRNQFSLHLGSLLRLPMREHLRLLLTTAAERLASQASAGAVASAAIAPDPLLKTIDMIGQTRWDFASAGPSGLRPVVAEFSRLLSKARFQLIHESDRAALAAALEEAPLFQDLFVIGFHSLHWPLWPLLEAAVRFSEKSVVCLTEPRAEAEELDTVWIGTWEDRFTPAQPVAAEPPGGPLHAGLLLPETPSARLQRETAPVAEIEFLVGLDTANHAEAIAAKAMHLLADTQCERLGILFPAAGALSRRVAMRLDEAGIIYDDGLAYSSPGPQEIDISWDAWRALQEDPRVAVLIRFLRTCQDMPFGSLLFDEACFELQRVFQELLIDDLEVLADFLEQHPRERSRRLAEALRARPTLPDRATLGDFIERTEVVFRQLGWNDRVDMLQRFAPDWRWSRDLRISRRAWLRWLDEILVSWQSRRAEAGSHPYSRVHLLPYIQADSQSWTHLILAGLNEGHWPPALEEGGFLGEEEIAALNGSVRNLNVRTAIQGSQGEGHMAVQSGHTMCLGPLEKRVIVERQFLNTLESTTVSIVATMQLHDESAPERPLNPSEFFTRLHYSARGRALSQQSLAALQSETARWLAHVALPQSLPSPAESVAQTRLAFDARRQAGRPYGEYEFALRGAPQPPLRLSATDWENAFSAPAQKFLAKVLRVHPELQEEETPWALTQGSWVHRWLSTIAGRSEPAKLAALPAPEELRERVRGAAENFHTLVVSALSVRQRPLPDWWQSAWQQAWSTTRQIADALSKIEGYSHVGTEWNLDDTPLPLDAGTLYVRGRIDLVLCTSDSLDTVWLADYKTGARKPLSLKDLSTGNGLQLALYALALRARGARDVGLSLITTDIVPDEPQIGIDELDALSGLWRGLWHMQETGIFGMIGTLRDEFGFGRDYPLATLAIDEEILAEKWALSHPDFFPEKDHA